jgi:periplasmic divalent cation tolerance protein
MTLMVDGGAMELIYTVCRDLEEASRIGRRLVEERLAACVNIFPIHSFYWWEGEVIADQEAVLLVKTRQGNFDTVSDRIASMHSYSVPAIFSLPVERVRQSYLQWLVTETR